MERRHFLTLALSLLLVLALIPALSACSATPTATAAPTATPTPAPLKVVVAVASEEKPLSYTDDTGKLVGYEVDALKAIDALLPDYEFDLQAVDGDSEQIGLDSGKYALAAEGYFKTDERAAKYLLPTENIGVSLITITVRGDDTSIATLDDLVGKKVAPVSPNGGIFNLLTKYNDTHDKKITIETQEGLTAADRYQGVADGKWDATVLPSLGFNEVKTSLNLDIKQTAPVKINPTYFLLSKTQTDLLAKVDAALKALKADGSLSKLSVQYFGEDVLKYYTPS